MRFLISLEIDQYLKKDTRVTVIFNDNILNTSTQ